MVKTDTKEITSGMTIAVHSGDFHADDAFAVAALQLIEPSIKVIRTRDPDIYNKADMRVDVGLDYDAEAGSYDHHQRERVRKHPSGISYAAFGLIWYHYGNKLVSCKEAHERVRRILVEPVDAEDNGIHCADKMKYRPYSTGLAVNRFNPLRDEDATGKEFDEAVEFATGILKREIKNAETLVSMLPIVREAVEKSNDKEIVVLKKSIPWRHAMHEYPDVLYVIYPSKGDDNWIIRGVPTTEESFGLRKPFPKRWGGLRSDELSKLTRVEDALFCTGTFSSPELNQKKGL